jgi:amidase
MDDLIDRNDATGLAALVANGQVTAAELLEAAIARADATAALNHTPIRFDDVARAQAREPLAGPFAGVPFLLKDIGQEFAGQPHTQAAAPYRNRRATAHSTYTQRCLDAGLVIFGRTATPELGLRAQTESRLSGPTRNPWDTTRSPGGSSGGSAAAVAARVVPMAGANDGGGSIRIPAGYCGLFGLKPSTGRVSWGPSQGLIWEGASSNGVLSHSVRDTARMLDVLSAGRRRVFLRTAARPPLCRRSRCTAGPLAHWLFHHLAARHGGGPGQHPGRARRRPAAGIARPRGRGSWPRH